MGEEVRGQEGGFPVEEARGAVEEKIRGFLERSPVPRSLAWIKLRIGYPEACLAANVLSGLERSGVAASARAGLWGALREEGGPAGWRGRGGAFDPMSLVGPVWEPRVAAELRRRGLEVEQQRHVLSFYLDISMEAGNGGLLDVEVDGRCHRLPGGRRRPSDMVRDALLRMNGWTVCRVWVRDLMADFDGQIERILCEWESVSGKG